MTFSVIMGYQILAWDHRIVPRIRLITTDMRTRNNMQAVMEDTAIRHEGETGGGLPK